MASIYEWLSEAGFDFKLGTIIYQGVGEDSCAPGWSTPTMACTITDDALHKQFDCGYGAPECPRFFARCGNWVYFPEQYDGATGLVKVNIRPSHYLDIKNHTPYPGG